MLRAVCFSLYGSGVAIDDHFYDLDHDWNFTQTKPFWSTKMRWLKRCHQVLLTPLTTFTDPSKVATSSSRISETNSPYLTLFKCHCSENFEVLQKSNGTIYKPMPNIKWLQGKAGLIAFWFSLLKFQISVTRSLKRFNHMNQLSK